jgi:hypothetical protein
MPSLLPEMEYVAGYCDECMKHDRQPERCVGGYNNTRCLGESIVS